MSDSSLERAFIAPTVKDRTFAYDVLRGFAIVGILFANITYFGLPRMAETLGPVQVLTGTDRIVDQFTILLVNGKFRSMLAVLFGVGIWLQYEKRSQVPGNWPGGYLKRTAVLAAIGLMHGIFLWYGDILFMYALAAGFACWAVNWPEARLIKSVAISGALAVVASLAMIAMGEPEKATSVQLSEMARELRVFSMGGYSEQLPMRAIEFGRSMTGFLLYLPFLLALMFMGVLIARQGVLRRPDLHGKAIRNMLLVGFGLGLPLGGLAAAMQGTRWSEGFYLATELLFGPLLAVGLLALLSIAAEKHWLLSLQRRLAHVGQMALSNYLLQTVLATSLFYSWGLGWFGRLDRLELAAVAVGIVAVQLAFSSLWMHCFALGPVEWVWRSLAEGRRFAMLRKETA